MNIQWYPGHMTKTIRQMSEDVKTVDAVCEIIDARIPISSRNPDLEELTRHKPKMIIFNKKDLADPNKTREWVRFFQNDNTVCLEINSKDGSGVNRFVPTLKEKLLREKVERYVATGQAGRSLKVMIMGIPNVGKSTFINRLVGRNVAHAEDRPGVTRSKQWLHIEGAVSLMDTPGMLWPKFEDEKIGQNLAFCGSIKDDIMDIETLAKLFVDKIRVLYPDALSNRYKIPSDTDKTGFDLMELIARKRGFLVSGGEVDYERCAKIILDEFRGGALGQITLESVEDVYADV